MERTIPFILPWDESLVIGSDTCTRVNDADFQPPCKFTGKLKKVTLTINRPQLSPEDIKKFQQAEEAAAKSDNFGFGLHQICTTRCNCSPF